MIRESLLYLLGGLAVRAAGFLMIPFYSSHLTPDQYGIIELIELISQVVNLAIGLNLFGGSLIRLYQETADPVRQRRVASTAILSALVINIAGCAVGIAGAGPVLRLLSSSPSMTSLLQYTVLSLLLSNMVELCISYERLRRRAGLVVTYWVVSLVLTLSLNVYFIAYQGKGVWGFVLSKLLVSAGGAALLLTSAWREVGFGWHRAEALALLRFGAPLVLANLAFFLLHFGDRFFLTRFGTMADVGNYSLGYRFGFLVTFLAGEPFGKAFTVRYVSRVRAPGWQQEFRSISRLLCGALVTVALIISVSSEEILHLMVTPPYYPAARVIPLIAAAYFIRELGDFFRNMLFINLRSKTVSVVSACAAGANALLNWLWIPHYGMMGAAWATVATWALYAGTLYVLAERDLHVGFPWKSYLGMSALGVTLYAASLPAVALPLAAQAAVDACLVAAFLAGLWWLGPLSEPERVLVREKVEAAKASWRKLRQGQ